MSNLSDLAKREREARRNSIYSHPNSVRQREAAKRTVSSTDIGPRQADARNALGLRHHEESKKLAQEQRVEFDKHRATNRPIPAGLEKQQKAARDELNAKHSRERQQQQDLHLQERAEERRRSAK